MSGGGPVARRARYCSLQARGSSLRRSGAIMAVTACSPLPASLRPAKRATPRRAAVTVRHRCNSTEANLAVRCPVPPVRSPRPGGLESLGVESQMTRIDWVCCIGRSGPPRTVSDCANSRDIAVSHATTIPPGGDLPARRQAQNRAQPLSASNATDPLRVRVRP